jgi:hypothetical protein
MRRVVAGIFLLLFGAATAQGQAKGRVVSVGFDGYYRTNAWTPMQVAITPPASGAQNYKLVVIQEDLDRDPIAFTRLVPVTGEGGVKEQKFWMYFVPQAGGLEVGTDRSEMNKKLRVYLADAAGKRLGQIDCGGISLKKPLDNENAERGQKLVLVVRDRPTDARLGVYHNARGGVENIVFHQVSPLELPDNAIGYQSVDAILWLDADTSPSRLRWESLSALHDWVREGGRLVICQAPQKWKQYTTGAFGEMVPVQFGDDYGGAALVDAELGLRALRILGGTDPTTLGRTKPFMDLSPVNRGLGDPWKPLTDRQFHLAHASAKKGANIELFADEWNNIPYLVRWRRGYGCVTWLAQDLSSDQFRHYGRDDLTWYGWTSVWDRVFDWRQDTVTPMMAELGVERGNWQAKTAYARYGEGTGSVDLSSATLKGMELPTRGAALVSLAVLFFIVYLAVAGPGSYLVLSRRKLASLSWPAFAICAGAATLLTIFLVGLVLRGKPDMAHVTVVRVAPGEDALVHAQVGLYIPRDGAQRIELRDTSAQRQSYVMPYPMHKRFMGEASEFLSSIEYEVQIPSMARDASEPLPQIAVPYRSTLKKLQAKWVGSSKATVEGRAALAPWPPMPYGVAVNRLGVNLHSVWMIYRQPDGVDRVLWVPDFIDPATSSARPAWLNNEQIDLGVHFARATVILDPNGTRAEFNRREYGWLNFGKDSWAERRWYRGLRSASDIHGGFGGDADRALQLLSIFERLPPPWSEAASEGSADRLELLRRAGRHLDASAAVAAGDLLILGRGDDRGPLPFRLDVAEEAVAGEGLCYYQIVIPMDRSQTVPKATRPATRTTGPATNPAG